MKKMLYTLAALITSACTSQAPDKTADSAPSAQDIEQFARTQTLTIDEYAQQLLNAPDAQVLDVRSAEEFAVNHIQGAVNIDFADSADMTQKLAALDKTRPTFTYSIREGRSVILAKQLKDQGFRTVYFMPGGIGTWVGAGYALESTVDASKSLDLDAYQKQVASSRLTFVDISSIHCGSCKRLHPILDSLEQQYPQVQVLRYEMDEQLLLVQALKVQSLPTLLFYVDGKEVWKHVGTQTSADLRALFAQYAR
jgi:rhodanese-related sulfurtransferase